MDARQHIWGIWSQKLYRWGVRDLVASFLEVAGPLTILGAQMVYVGQPLVGRFVSSLHLQALADLLEDPRQARAFASFLREKNAL